jgi:cytoskeletal protein CcmA (bactofilin family)
MTSPPASKSVPPLEVPATLDDRGTVRRDAVRAGRWSISGTVKVAGDVEAREVIARGQVTVGGKARAGAFQTRGTVDVSGPVEVQGLFLVHGTLRAAATVHAVDLTVEGIARSAGTVKVDRVASVVGTLDAPEVAAGAFRLQGVARIPGTLRAVEVSAELKDTSRFGPVIAREVRIHGKPSNLVDKALFHDRNVSVDRIEADSVDLEGVKVAFIRSPRIILGRDCHVTEVEGTIVRRHPSSHVGPESRTPPPYGLRR